ncbi:hypothetical protein [Diplocloster modestus]|uniref:Uncharacterized protein n=1 Tax=Diplocloster modestus TaxID=2850322 RepID=A0ABS6KCQ4_9FIRM|nr:hypothetical protein [Diplocloster modestus]MBU9728294.1 hypothetical protein [Diplocloster modestus]
MQCDCHQTEESYDYDKSVDKVRDIMSQEIRRKYDEFSEKAHGHICYWHMTYNEWDGMWNQNYDPMTCARMCMNIGKTCDLTHKPVSKKKGNVFYDVKVSYVRKDDTLFDGEEVVTITKGKRLFKTAKSITICEQVAKRSVREIERKEKDRYYAEVLLKGYKVEVLNVRAEQRESRDLMQDLQDIQDGIRITHASDLEKKDKMQKKENRKLAQEKRIAHLEKKLIEVGYYNLDDYSLDRVHADKWLGKDRITELEEIRKQKIKEEQEKPVQLSLFDMI